MILKRGDRVIMQYPIPGSVSKYTTPEEAANMVAGIHNRITTTLRTQGVEVIAWEAFSNATQASVLAVFRDEE